MSFTVSVIVSALGGLLLFLYIRKRKASQGILRPSMTAGLEGLNAFPEPIALTEAGAIVFHNVAFELELGRLAEKGTWTDWLTCVEPGERVDPEDAPTLHVARGAIRADVQFRTHDHRLLHWTAVPFPGLGRKLVLNIVRDVSAWASPQYDQAAFMNRAAHEIKTPVTSIKGYAELIELYARTGKEVTPEIAGRIVEQSNRLVHLVNQFLDVARLGTGRLNDSPEPVRLGALIPQIMDRIRRQFPGRSVILEMGPLPEALIDPARFEQVVREFVFNALQYSPPDQPVNVGVRVEHDSLQIRVTDHGIGIPPTERDQIYERFARGSNVSRMPGAGGYGLGLYLAREIISRWRGEIHIQRSDESGSIVEVTLPLRKFPPAHEQNFPQAGEEEEEEREGLTDRPIPHS